MLQVCGKAARGYSLSFFNGGLAQLARAFAWHASHLTNFDQCNILRFSSLSNKKNIKNIFLKTFLKLTFNCV